MNDLLVVPEITPTPSLTISDEAEQKKIQLLNCAFAITAVTSETSRDTAIAVAANIRAQLKRLEAARVEVKGPFMDVASKIDSVAKKYRTILIQEVDRMNMLVGSFEFDRRKELKDEEEALEQERLRLAQEATKDAPPDATAQERAAALESAAVAEEGIDAATGKIATLRASIEAAKPSGGALRKDWDIEVIDIRALMLAHPQCVEIAPRLMAIKDLLKIGINPVGVKATPKSTFSTRASK